jgi:hypothetical protein
MFLMLLIVWACVSMMGYAMAQGYVEGWLYRLNILSNLGLTENLHPYTLFIRTIMSLSACLPVFLMGGFLIALETGNSIALCYPFFFNGTKYYLRGRLGDKTYAKGWKSEPSKTSIARANLSYRNRVYGLCAGIAMLVVAIIHSFYLKP